MVLRKWFYTANLRSINHLKMTISFFFVVHHRLKSHGNDRDRCLHSSGVLLSYHPIESSSLYWILHISEIKHTRNETCAPWSLVVWLFETPKCEGEKCFDYVLGYSDTMGIFLQWQANLTPDCERHSGPSAPPWSARHYMKRFCARVNKEMWCETPKTLISSRLNPCHQVYGFNFAVQF
jgi:hypothetical protein